MYKPTTEVDSRRAHVLGKIDEDADQEANFYTSNLPDPITERRRLRCPIQVADQNAREWMAVLDPDLKGDADPEEDLKIQRRLLLQVGESVSKQASETARQRSLRSVSETRFVPISPTGFEDHEGGETASGGDFTTSGKRADGPGPSDAASRGSSRVMSSGSPTD